MPRLARENTLPSFQLAVDAGADGLELDVHATADGVVVVHHDATLRQGPAITDLTFEQLRAYDAAPGIPIPRLADVFEVAAGRATLFVEVKGVGIEQTVLDTLTGYAGEVAIHSFDHDLIARISRLDPSRRFGLLFEDEPVNVARSMAIAGALDVWPQWSVTSPGLVDMVHEAGGRVIVWTVNEQATAQRLTEVGVDGLCGDDVRLLSTE
jgi:glycerophosphoryl diester phosphodiesterase